MAFYILKEGLKNEGTLDSFGFGNCCLLLDSRTLARECVGRCSDTRCRFFGVGQWCSNRSFLGGYMAAIGEVKWVFVRGTWLQVRVKHIGKTGLALVDFLDGSGSALFPLESLRGAKES